MTYAHDFAIKAAGVITSIILTLLCVAFPAIAAVYTYDDLNRLTTATYEDGQKLTYTYDAGGNLLTVIAQDTTQLAVYSSDPANGATGIPVNKNITVTFSQNLQPGDTFSNITLKAGETVVAYTYGISGSVLTLDPVENLNCSVAYTVFFPAGAVKNSAGNALATPYIFNFTTGDAPNTKPAIVSTDPANVASGVPENKNIIVTFNTSVQSEDGVWQDRPRGRER